MIQKPGKNLLIKVMWVFGNFREAEKSTKGKDPLLVEAAHLLAEVDKVLLYLWAGVCSLAAGECSAADLECSSAAWEYWSAAWGCL